MTNKIKEGIRNFGLTSLAVDNATSVFLMTFMIMIFGIMSYDQMPKEQYPEAAFPTVFINTPYFGNSAKDIESLVTKPIEKELQSIEGVEDISSTSIQDYSVITAEFGTDMDMDDVIRKVKDAVDNAKKELPNDLDDDPMVVEVNASEFPIMTINMSGDFGMDELREYAEYMEDEIEDMDEISKVVIKGVLEREVKIDIDMIKMMSLKVSFEDIENAISAENITMSAGEIVRNDFRRAIRVVGEFETMEDIENVIVKSENQRPIFLRDIGKVTYGFKDRTSIARSDGFPVASLDVIKRSGENLLNASDKIKLVIEEAEKNVLPSDMKITIFNDQSINTRNQVNNLENSIISGVILVVIVLLFFLGLRNAVFVGMAIPLSMLTGIIVLHATGTTMNLVVLFGLILALGMLVDNGIVVVENVYRYMQNGKSGDVSAKQGTGEVAWPIIASTATTLAAFLPLAFWPGIMGEFMLYLPLTLIIVLSSSLFVALVINPVFTAKLMKVDKFKEDKAVRKRKRRNVLLGVLMMLVVALVGHLTKIYAMRNLLVLVAIITLINTFVLRGASIYFQKNIMVALERAYDRFVRMALHKLFPVATFAGTIGLLFFAIWLLSVKMPKVEFFPNIDAIYINAFVELPIGKDIEATNAIMLKMEERVTEAMAPYESIIESILSQIGANTADPNTPPEPGVTPHKARLTVAFVPTEDRDGVSTRDALDDLREAVLGVYPGVQVVVDQNASGPPAGKPVNLELSGESIDVLAIESEKLISYLNSYGIPGIEQLQADVKNGKPELIINIDRDAARRYQLSTYSIANAIRTSVFGKEVSKFKVGDDEYPIQLRLDPRYRHNVTDLLNQKVTFRNQSTGKIIQVPISAVATVTNTSTYSAVKRKNSDRVITIFSNVLEGYNANEIVAQLRDAMTEYDLPVGYNYEFTGEQEQQAEDMAFLANAFLIALFLIFIILVSQFNSLTSPFIIMISVLFSTIGVFLGYALTGMTISVIFTGVGLVSLAGVVVNNAIVLVDYISLLIKRKRLEKNVKSMFDLTKDEVKNAIIDAGSTRLRPVLLTAITTILGLIPLAIGFNFNFFTFISDLDPQYFVGGDNSAMWGPMAWTVIYGLVFATFLTLIVVPVMYWLAYRGKLVLRQLLSGKKENSITPAT
ncbi:MAG: AcrB/AcrD/AcrF family protein [Bacteroidetes bacterium]|nr:MAG: AcrB/AcrD/AcrF family protein [Bacteroidota bacterium]